MFDFLENTIRTKVANDIAASIPSSGPPVGLALNKSLNYNPGYQYTLPGNTHVRAGYASCGIWGRSDHKDGGGDAEGGGDLDRTVYRNFLRESYGLELERCHLLSNSVGGSGEAKNWFPGPRATNMLQSTKYEGTHTTAVNGIDTLRGYRGGAIDSSGDIKSKSFFSPEKVYLGRYQEVAYEEITASQAEGKFSGNLGYEQGEIIIPSGNWNNEIHLVPDKTGTIPSLYVLPENLESSATQFGEDQGREYAANDLKAEIKILMNHWYSEEFPNLALENIPNEQKLMLFDRIISHQNIRGLTADGLEMME